MNFIMKSEQKPIDMEQKQTILKLPNNYDVGQKERFDSKETKITERSPEGYELKEKDLLIWKTDYAEKRTLQMETPVVENTTATTATNSTTQYSLSVLCFSNCFMAYVLLVWRYLFRNRISAIK